MIYTRKFDYTGKVRGERKKAETANGRTLLREAVMKEYGVDTGTLTTEYGEYGKPYFKERPDIHFSISHSGEYAAIVLSDSEVGIDIQQVREIKPKLVEKLCDEAERRYVYESVDKDKAFITLWALKESYIKAIGRGMSFPMDEINFRLDSSCGEIQGEISNREGSYTVRDMGGYVLAVCFMQISEQRFSKGEYV